VRTEARRRGGGLHLLKCYAKGVSAGAAADVGCTTASTDRLRGLHQAEAANICTFTGSSGVGTA